MAKGGMREQMPTVATWIDQLRAAFGAESIDRQIRAGMRGESVFYASENGHTVGTPSPPRTRVKWDERGIPYVEGATETEQGRKQDANTQTSKGVR